jgi:hypothetical protein
MSICIFKMWDSFQFGILRLKFLNLFFSAVSLFKELGLLRQYSVWLETLWPGFDPWQRQRIFPSSCVQTRSEAHPASIKWVLGVLSPGVNHVRGVMLTTHPLLVPKSSMSKTYVLPLPLIACMSVAGQLYFIFVSLFKIRNKQITLHMLMYMLVIWWKHVLFLNIII